MTPSKSISKRVFMILRWNILIFGRVHSNPFVLKTYGPTIIFSTQTLINNWSCTCVWIDIQYTQINLFFFICCCWVYSRLYAFFTNGFYCHMPFLLSALFFSIEILFWVILHRILIFLHNNLDVDVFLIKFFLFWKGGGESGELQDLF